MGSLDNEFVDYDDALYVAHNPRVLGGLSPSNALWAWSTFYAANYHPLTWLSLMADASQGTGPRGFHRTNLALHVLSTLCLFGWLRDSTGRHLASAWVAALFAVHPLHVESVAWIAERKDVLSTFLGMSAIWLYVSWARTRRRELYVGSLILYLLSLLAKQTLVTLPILLIALDVWPLKRAKKSGGLEAKEKAPFLLLAGVFSVLVFWAQRSGEAVQSFERFPLDIRIANAFRSIVAYLIDAFYPLQLTFFHPHPGARGSWPLASASAALLLAVSVAAWGLRKSAPWIAVGWSWCLVSLLPVLGLIQVGEQARADRYTYVPMIGIDIALAFTLDALLSRVRLARAWGMVITIAVFSILIVLTRRQVDVWQSSESLYRHALALDDDNDVAHNNLSRLLMEQGKSGEAEEHARKALAARPNDPDRHSNLGAILAFKGQVKEAIAAHERALAIDSKAVNALNNLAWLLATWPNDQWRDGGRAVELSRQANERTNHRDPALLDTLAAALAETGQWDEAIDVARRAADLARQRRNDVLAREIDDRRHRYQAHRPYREPVVPSDNLP